MEADCFRGIVTRCWSKWKRRFNPDWFSTCQL